MAPLLFFLLGGLCALFSLTTSSRASSAKKCEDVKSDGCVSEETPQRRREEAGAAGRPGEGPGHRLLHVRPRRRRLHHGGGAGGVAAAPRHRRVGRRGRGHGGARRRQQRRAHRHPRVPRALRLHRKHQHNAAGAGDFGVVAREVPVEGADDDEEAEEEEDEERDLREAFDVFDGNKDGLISAEELGTVLGSLGLRRQGNGRTAVADCRDMIRLVDSDGDGMVSFEEFKRMMTVVKA